MHLYSYCSRTGTYKYYYPRWEDYVFPLFVCLLATLCRNYSTNSLQFVQFTVSAQTRRHLVHNISSSSSVVFCVQQVFDILSLCLHPSLSSAARLSATNSPSFVKAYSTLILLPLVSLHYPSILPSHNFVQKSVVPQNMAKSIEVSFAKQSLVFACLHVTLVTLSAMWCGFNTTGIYSTWWPEPPFVNQ